MAYRSAHAADVKAAPCRGRRRANRGRPVGGARLMGQEQDTTGRVFVSAETAADLLGKESWNVNIHREV